MTQPAPTLPTIAILAGGKATRLGELAATLPKALQPIGDRPFLAWQLDLIAAQGFHDVVLCIGHLGDQIQHALPNITPNGMRVRCSSEGGQALGTGGALKHALPLLSDPFMVLYGDSYLQDDYVRVFRAFETARADGSPAEAMMTIFRNENRFGPSNIEYSGGQILRYEKKARDSRMQYIDWGLGVVTHAAFDTFRNGFDLADVYQRTLRANRLVAHELHRRFYEIGSPDALNELRNLLAGVSGDED